MSEKNSFWEWLGYTRTPDWGKARGLGGFLGFALFLVALVIGIAGLAGLIKALTLYVINGDESGDPSAAARNIGLLLAAAFGAPFVAWQAIVRQKQTDIAEQSHFADLINKATENLSKVQPTAPESDKTLPVMEARIGGLYALERLMLGREQDAIQAIDLICAYIRTNAPVETAASYNTQIYHTELGRGASEYDALSAAGLGQAPLGELNANWRRFIRPRPDIQTAIEILCNGPIPEGYGFNLSETNLQGAVFSETIEAVTINFRNARLEGAQFHNFRFKNTNFRDANVDLCLFLECEFSEGTDRVNTCFDYAAFRKCDSSNLQLTASQRKFIFTDRETVWSDRILENLKTRPDLSHVWEKQWHDGQFIKAYEKWLERDV
ncbi:pentapeptide repeat-containing protein [Celeribacter naphthalenivorans]|uniref:pentapeptide repeat-containing protein n=1 Tax=Celeribacter naphthalenivorans TaxID=1614694 RepID=UPI001CFAAEC3|nr:pentapeptide repeat-containing protein [Celeribacter naphthalenivorans]